ncbi:MAG: hypothetical protein J6S61_05215, partial [Elusimicrobiaceae bacterium]|nr:hypothetical protein [Elusimicrobiaceae bacterium]
QKITANYLNGRMNTLFNAQKRHLNNLLSISDVIEEHPKIEDISSALKPVYFRNMESRYNYLKTQYEKESRIRNEFIKDLADNQAYYQRTFSEDTDKLIKQLQKVESSLSRETIEFFSKKAYTAEEVLRYFEARLPEEQKAVLFALKVADNDQTIAELIPHIRYYLKHTNRRLWKLDKFSAEKLAVTLSKMDLAKRVDYIDDLLDFAPETMALRKEIKTAEKSIGKKIISRKKIKLSGTFAAIGAFLLASTITEVKADNNFRGAISPYRLAQIKHKIDEGQMITLQELSAYYTDERNSEEIIKNPKGLFEAFEIAITINDCLDSLYAKDPPANTKKQVEDNIDKRLKEVNWKKVTFKVGTL